MLTAANTNSPSLSQSFTYDVAGNMLSNSAVGCHSSVALMAFSPCNSPPDCCIRPKAGTARSAYPSQGSVALQPHAVTSAGPWVMAFSPQNDPPDRFAGDTGRFEVAYDQNGNQVSRITAPVTDRSIAYDDGYLR